MFEATAIGWPRRVQLRQDLAHVRQEARLLDRHLWIALAEEPDSLGGPPRADRFLQEPLDPVSDHRAERRPERERGLAQALHRVGQRVTDRVVAVDEGSVQVEDHE